MTVAPNFLTDALPLIIRPKPRGVPPLRILMLTDCPWLAWTRLAYRPSYRDGRNASTFWGLGLNIAPNEGEAAIAFFTF